MADDMETSELRSLTLELSRIRCTLETVMETLVQLNERMSRLERASADSRRHELKAVK